MADEPVDELDVELARLTDDRERGTPAIADRVRPVVGQPAETVDGSGGRGGVADAGRWQRLLVAAEEAMRGKISSPGSEVETSTTIIRALAGVPSSAA